MLALIDTGASMSLLSDEVCKRVFKGMGRAFRLLSSDAKLTTLGGHPLRVRGRVEFEVEGVGVVSFVVVSGVKHDAIVGWDMLHHHGWALTDSGGMEDATLLWGQRAFPLSNAIMEMGEVAEVDAGCLTRVLARHKSGTEIAVFEAGEEWVTLEDEADQAAPRFPSETDGLDDRAVKDAQQEAFPELIEKAEAGEGEVILAEGLLYSIARPGKMKAAYPRLILPAEFRQEIMKKCHEESGHAGRFKTMSRIQENYVWPGMHNEIKRYLERCGLCLVHRARVELPPMGEMPLARSPG